MSSQKKQTALNPHVQADALADALAGKGFITTVLKTGGHRMHPCVRVSWGLHQRAAEYIYAAPDGGAWRFWWSRLEPIAPIRQVRHTADEIARVLAPGLDLIPDEVTWP